MLAPRDAVQTEVGLIYHMKLLCSLGSSLHYCNTAPAERTCSTPRCSLSTPRARAQSLFASTFRLGSPSSPLKEGPNAGVKGDHPFECVFAPSNLEDTLVLCRCEKAISPVNRTAHRESKLRSLAFPPQKNLDSKMVLLTLLLSWKTPYAFGKS